MKPYTLLAPIYEASMDEALFKQILYTIKPYLKGDLLDLGCGSGAMARAVSEDVKSVDACDIDETMLENARKKAEAENLSINFFIHDMHEKLDKQYDIVLATLDVFNHAPDFDHFKKAFMNALDALKPGGILVFDVLRCDFIKTYRDFEETIDTNEGPLLWKANLLDDDCTVKHTFEIGDKTSSLTERSYSEKKIVKLFKKDKNIQVLKREIFEDRMLFMIKKYD
ncbi:MAG: class I SAM-dependent methyltransferase [Bacillota bacterium]